MLRITSLERRAQTWDDGLMRAIVIPGSVVSALVLLAIGPASGVSQPVDSGIRGRVLLSPTCPVQRPGQSCTRPYRAWMTIRREPSGAVALRVRSSPAGRFTARVPAGRYLLQPRNARPFPRARPQTVTVERHRFTEVTVSFDTGIR
jgi:hypothetical protein